MSGNKYDDILKNMDISPRNKAEGVLQLMENYRPSMQVDSSFKSNLRKKLLSQLQKKKFIWTLYLPSFSLLITSFILCLGVWKIWGNTLLGGANTTNILTSSSKEILQGNQDEDKEEAKSFSLAGTPAPNNGTQAETHDARPTGGDSALYRAKNTQPPEIMANRMQKIEDVSAEIGAIAQDINTLAEGGNSPLPEDTLAPQAKMATLSLISPSPSSGSNISIIYPKVMVVYKKMSPWTLSEQVSRSGSGITKKSERTISPYDLGLNLSKVGDVSQVAIEYRGARKIGQNEYFLIPTMKYKNASNNFFWYPLISGYVLD